jgi:hypothetical protein
MKAKVKPVCRKCYHYFSCQISALPRKPTSCNEFTPAKPKSKNHAGGC